MVVRHDPQDLHAENHPRSVYSSNSWKINSQWDWGNGASIPDPAYCDKFYNRTIDLNNKYHPDLIYLDDTALPLQPIGGAGLKIAAHSYNANSKLHGQKDDGPLFGKILNAEQRQ